MRKIALVLCMIVYNVAYASEPQWWNCKQAFKGKTYKGYTCSSETQYDVSLRFCRDVVPSSLYTACERLASNAIGGWGPPVCKATHNACVE